MLKGLIRESKDLAKEIVSDRRDSINRIKYERKCGKMKKKYCYHCRMWATCTGHHGCDNGMYETIECP